MNNDYISRQMENKKTYKMNSGENLVFYYNDNRIGLITVEAMDTIIDQLNNSVEVVRCKDCKYDHKCSHNIIRPSKGGGVIYCPLEYCSEGEKNG